MATGSPGIKQAGSARPRHSFPSGTQVRLSWRRLTCVDKGCVTPGPRTWRLLPDTPLVRTRGPRARGLREEKPSAGELTDGGRRPCRQNSRQRGSPARPLCPARRTQRRASRGPPPLREPPPRQWLSARCSVQGESCSQNSRSSGRDSRPHCCVAGGAVWDGSVGHGLSPSSLDPLPPPPLGTETAAPRG